MRACKVCGGGIGEPGEITGWAGKWCHCNIFSSAPMETPKEHIERRKLPDGLMDKIDAILEKNSIKEGVDSTLEERGKRYGKFIGHAAIAQTLKSAMQNTAAWNSLHSDQKEALEMIQHKIARILNGDPDYADSWHDIAGYATLVENRLNGKVV
jgi:hypothetical protein